MIPKITPDVGAVIETIEKANKTLFYSKPKTSMKYFVSQNCTPVAI